MQRDPEPDLQDNAQTTTRRAQRRDGLLLLAVFGGLALLVAVASLL
jgi:hypothetical protein